jgi:hypothetical protein
MCREIFMRVIVMSWPQSGTQTIIDCILTNKPSTLMQDTIVYRGSDVRTGHFLLISNFVMLKRWKE